MFYCKNGMDKVFLIGGSKSWSKRIDEFVTKDIPRSAQIAVVATAAVNDPNPKYDQYTYFEVLKKQYQKLGFAKFDLVNIEKKSDSNKPSIIKQLNRADVIYLGGGDTRFLLNCLVKTRAASTIKEQVRKGKLIIGNSAGAMVLCEKVPIEIERSKKKEFELWPGLNVLSKLFILAHVNRWNRQRQFRRLADSNPILVGLGLPEYSIAKISDKRITIYCLKSTRLKKTFSKKHIR